VFVSAGYRVLQRFAEGTPCPLGLAPLRQPRTLVGLRAEEAARDLPGTTASFLFEYRKPVLGLTSAERRLLVHATAGFTDQEIASALGLSPNTVKACWRQIYQRFDARAPFVTSDVGAGADDSVRGREKRRHVVAYLADNLQELRPYELE
jgi:DNA-binding NarL/FixJ family response regulator